MEHIRVNDKIRLEKINLSMAQVIFDTIDSDRSHLKEWLPFIDQTKQISDTEAFISSVSGSNKDNIYTIWYKEEFAGLMGFKDTDWVNRKTEIGYWLRSKLQGKGIATLCVQKLISFAFKNQKLNRIQIKVAQKNNRSASIPQKLGFQLEGVERAGELHQNRYLDLEVYSLLKSDWLK
ncbi:GNAT family protein [Prolixibacteraceae bacterium Z1-6]|uniref:GNAT family protein n=1 Tax=Draconibacterium aestuarii TaxID=2998507 RepID=A0A9X3J6J2_9BACT|nr:GNAT family protein [Prolixibacteraceae bacterium Z1-6]